MTTPTPDEIRLIRTTAGMTRREAAELVHATERSWKAWEAGQNPMHAGLWELFNLKVKSRLRRN